MDTLKALGAAAGIGGIGVGAAVLIFREIIRKNIFPTLDRRRGFIVIMTIVILTWIISLFAIFAYWKGNNPYVKTDPDVDFEFSKTGVFYCDSSNVMDPKVDKREYIRLTVYNCNPVTNGDQGTFTRGTTRERRIEGEDGSVFLTRGIQRSGSGYYYCGASSSTSTGPRLNQIIDNEYYANMAHYKSSKLCSYTLNIYGS